MSTVSPELPSPGEWLRWQVQIVDELQAGMQSRVFDAVLEGARVAVKLTEARGADHSLLVSRLEAVEALGAGHPGTVPPIRVAGALVQPIGDWLMTATPFVEGEPLEVGSPVHARLLGGTLARLHEAMSRLEPFGIPPIAALRSTGRDAQRSGWQLLHGDFSARNVIVTPKIVRILDFDDCGYGPIEYDVANSLYMVLFDSDVTDHSEHLEVFRPAFLAGYAEVSGRGLDEPAIDDMVEVRIAALGHWLDDLPSAPIGIRTSTPEWLETLASFVRRWGPEQRR